MIYPYVSSFLLATIAITLFARWCMVWQSHGQPVPVWRQVGLAFLLGLPIYLVTLVFAIIAELRAIDSIGFGVFVLPLIITSVGFLPATILGFWQHHPFFGVGIIVTIVIGLSLTQPIFSLVYPFISDRPGPTSRADGLTEADSVVGNSAVGRA